LGGELCACVCVATAFPAWLIRATCSFAFLTAPFWHLTRQGATRAEGCQGRGGMLSHNPYIPTFTLAAAVLQPHHARHMRAGTLPSGSSNPPIQPNPVCCHHTRMCRTPPCWPPVYGRARCCTAGCSTGCLCTWVC